MICCRNFSPFSAPLESQLIQPLLRLLVILNFAVPVPMKTKCPKHKLALAMVVTWINNDDDDNNIFLSSLSN